MSTQADRLNTALTGRYRIERELGAGGMATVYLAEDLKHDRKVAIKVLKPELAAVLGAERFVVEIKTTAAMSHPHILPLFDSGTADGFLFYVMPYIQGETIREKLNRETQFGVDEAVRIAREVADALDYAHRHGVIHRDIKPENILLHDGRAMVMDFGIALAVSAAAGGRMTETGLSLGTPHYMSPEQATAEKEITARSDQYSLASVLYEMLAGQPPHIGGAAQQVIMRIITDVARPVHEIRKNVPANVDAALAKALEKLPADRFESAARFSEALANASFTTTAHSPARAAGARRSYARDLIFAALGALVLGAGWLTFGRRATEPKAVVRTAFILSDSLRLTVNTGSGISMSRDGRVIAFAAGAISDITAPAIWYRTSDQLELRPIPDSKGAANVAVSADGKHVAFIRNRTGFVATFDGAPAIAVVPDSATNELAWTADGSVIASISQTGLVRYPMSGGAGVRLTTIDHAANEASHFSADALPNGKGIIFTVSHNPSTLTNLFDIAVLDLRTGKHRILARGVFGRYAASGHLIYVTTDGTLMAAPFDTDKLEMTGPAVAVGGDVAIVRSGGVHLAMSNDGTLLYATGAARNSVRELVWVSRDGTAGAVDASWRASFDAVAVSPDSRRLAVSILDHSRADVWVRQVDGGTTSKLTSEGTLNYRPSWYPDGSKIAYISNADGQLHLVGRRADGVGPVENLVREKRSLSQGFFSRDGKWIVYRSNANDAGNGDIMALHPGDSVPIPVVATPVTERFPALSPDGRWLAYRSDEKEPSEVYVRPFPDVNGGKWPVSAGGGSEPVWSHSGNELFYINGNGEMVSATINARPTFSVASRRVLFKLPVNVYRTISHQTFDVTPDDRRFVMIRDAEQTAGPALRPATPMLLVSNWFDELKAKVPLKQ